MGEKGVGWEVEVEPKCGGCVSQKYQIDGLGEEGERAVWEFCGAFPLQEIGNGRRACREGWRNRGEEFDMLAAVACEDSMGVHVVLEREIADGLETGVGWITIEDMLATDWYLEKEIKSTQ